MSVHRVLSRRATATALLAAGTAACLLFPTTATAGTAPSGAASAEPAAYTLPPAGAGFDYQIGGVYTPPAGVKVVSRDHTASPAPGVYNICYVNAFQAQPGAEGDWDADLLLRDAGGKVVYDGAWGEAVLDIRTADKRQRIAAKVGGWIDGCADKGFKAVEPDNYDTFTRFSEYLTANQAKAFISLLADRSHSRGLAIAQKNTSELASSGKESGLDFAVAEECGTWEECDSYTAEYGNNVIVIEYSAGGLSKACASWGDSLSIVRRDVEVKPQGASGYLRQTC
ncbi:endo alpha-1,4 polygalactosaminidase [Streptomyces rubiginosohelvolus]|uniref:endo alpha-1,4 polygalactosaminidase n=1 Tax=Streptomyces rubiginosohelvolus TaxID=67362 RepID=UPI0033D00F66